MTFEYNHPHLKQHRKDLRNNQTETEVKLWQRLKGRRLNNLKFCRQYGVGPYILDFYCPEKRFAIELDGSQHLDPNIEQYDKERTDYLQLHNIKVLRFWNSDIINNIEGVLESILQEVI